MTIAEAIAATAEQLHEVSTTPQLDAELLFAHTVQKNRAYILSHANDDYEQSRTFDALIAQRVAGVPVAYLVGVKEFYGRDFAVDERVLIPRPETEMIIDEELKSLVDIEKPRILDVGTGSGIIAITLALEVSDATVIATDLSAPALDVAAYNANELDARVSFRKGDLFDALEGEEGGFDLIVSNPPYVDLSTVHLNNPYSSGLQHEPEQALEPLSDDAFSIIQTLIDQSPQWLAPKGSLLVEIGFDQGQSALEAATAVFPTKEIEVQQDLAGIDRLLVIR